MPIIAIANQKGGVGKTTTAINLAVCLAETGYNILLIDTDPQGNATSGLGIDKKSIQNGTYQALINGADNLVEACVVKTYVSNLDIMPANVQLTGAEIELVQVENREYKLKAGIENLKNKYKFIIIDCPPSLGIITINALCTADKVIIPVQCEYYALEGLGQLLEIIQMVHNNLNPDLAVAGILLTMYDIRTNLNKQVEEDIRAHFSNLTYNTIIPRNIRIGESPSFGQAIVSYDPLSSGSMAYKQLTKEILEKYDQESAG